MPNTVLLKTTVSTGIPWRGVEFAEVEARTVSDQHPVGALVGEVDTEAHYRPISINAVGLRRRRVLTLVLCLVDAPEPMTGRRVVDWGSRCAPRPTA